MADRDLNKAYYQNRAKSGGIYNTAPEDKDRDDEGGRDRPLLPRPSKVTVDPNKAARDKANAQAKARAKRENENTKALAKQQYGLLSGFGKARDTKLSNIAKAMADADAMLLKNYGISLGSLTGNRRDNEMAEADASFSNVSNAVRERSDILAEAASQGAGETDQLRAQLQALRNYGANQGEVNRSFFDTQRSINNSLNSLNSDVATSRANVYSQAESDREATWANYYNQTADTWTQIANIENANTNVKGDGSVEYKKQYKQAGKEAQKAAGGSYKRKAAPASLSAWSGKGSTEERSLSSSNRAAAVNLGEQKKPEGATLRKW